MSHKQNSPSLTDAHGELVVDIDFVDMGYMLDAESYENTLDALVKNKASDYESSGEISCQAKAKHTPAQPEHWKTAYQKLSKRARDNEAYCLYANHQGDLRAEVHLYRRWKDRY